MPVIKGIMGRTEPYPSISQISQILNTILVQLGLKSNVGHTHVISDVTGLAAALAGGGGGGGLTTYDHTQAVADTVWTIDHMLARKPLVQSYTAAGAAVIGDVVHVTNNQVTITFLSAQDGTARLV